MRLLTLKVRLEGHGDTASANSLFAAINTVEAYTQVIGNATDTKSANSLFGTLNTVQNYAKVIGTDADTSSATSVYGRLMSVRSYAEQLLSEVQATEAQLGAKGASNNVLDMLQTISQATTGLQKSVVTLSETVPSTFQDVTKNVVQTVVNATAESAKSIGLKISGLRGLSEKELENTDKVKAKLLEVKAILDAINEAKGTGNKVVVKGWLQSE